MDDERIGRLLKGYVLPAPSRDLDRRVLNDGAAIMSHSQERTTLEDVAVSLLHQFGFGYLVWAFDFVTTTDAEYSVDFI